MTKNKSLFSGVGDGNRVKSIRLQGDKHTQGKREEKNCESSHTGPNQQHLPTCQDPAARARVGEAGEEVPGTGG